MNVRLWHSEQLGILLTYLHRLGRLASYLRLPVADIIVLVVV
jgi:hypothetical protein